MKDTETPPLVNEEPDDPVLGIVCALNLEVAPFLRRTEQFKTERGNGFSFHGCRFNDTRICVAVGGAGRDRAKQATHALIDAFQPPWVLSVGFSGALVENLRRGHIVVADGITDRSGQNRLSIDVRMQPAPQQGIHVGHLCTTDEIVRLVSEKQQLAISTGAIAVDMESLGVAEACRDRHTKFMAIRVISDGLESDLPQEVVALLGKTGSVRAGALFGSLLKRPSCVKDLWNLREQAADAAEHLARFLPGVIRTLTQSMGLGTRD